MRGRFWETLAAMLLLCSVAGPWFGCSRNPLGRQAISGVVTLDGVPLDDGKIEFAPQKQKGTVGSGCAIREGKYHIPTLKGLPPGEYLVRISGLEKHADTNTSFAGIPPPSRERIPPEYNVRSKLIVRVTEDGPNTFNFDITTVRMSP